MNSQIFLRVCACFVFLNFTGMNLLGNSSREVAVKTKDMDSALYFFSKARIPNHPDSVLFIKGLWYIDKADLNAEHLLLLQNEAEAWQKNFNPYYECLIQAHIYYRLVKTKKLYEAIHFGVQLVEKKNENNSRAQRDLKLLLLFELRIPFRISDKTHDGFEYYTGKLRESLRDNDSAIISICYFVLRGLVSAKGLEELAVFYSKKSIVYSDSTDRSVNPLSGFTPFKGREMYINNILNTGSHCFTADRYDESLAYFQTAADLYPEGPRKRLDSMNIFYMMYETALAKMALNQYDGLRERLTAALEIGKHVADDDYYVSGYYILGLYYFNCNKYDSAEIYFNQTIDILNSRNIALNSTVECMTPFYYMASLLINKKKYKEAEKLITREISMLLNLPVQLLAEYKLLSEIYFKMGDIKKEKEALRKCVEFQDQLKASEKEGKIMSFEIEQRIKEAEKTITNLTTENRIATISRNYLIGFAMMLLLVAAVIYNRFRVTRNQKAMIEKEKQRSDALLLNILPAEVAEELKNKGSSDARDYEWVTVMFTDFKDFTKISEKLSPGKILEEINFCFSEFDKIIMNHQIEKIKTIGDAYMCAGGLPQKNDTHPEDVVRAALEIRNFMDALNATKKSKGEVPFEIRIGINTGHVVAGIVGVKKFAYDIWGDAVNIAARMEQNSDAGKINISGSTYELIKDKFACTYRGKIEAKNKGMIDMYFVDSEK